MGRFDSLLDKLSSATDNTTVQPGDETQMANNPRNALADAVNGYLPDAMQIPKMTVADDKNYYKNLPQQMAGATMGSIGEAAEQAVPAAASRFAKILPGAESEASGSLGSVTVKPSAADLASDAQTASLAATSKPLTADAIRAARDAQYGTEIAARRAQMLKGAITPDAYQSFVQEMTNKVRGN